MMRGRESVPAIVEFCLAGWGGVLKGGGAWRATPRAISGCDLFLELHRASPHSTSPRHPS
jgi:hypothetical protein